MPAPRTPPPPPPPPYTLTDTPLSYPPRIEFPDHDEADLDSLKSLGIKLSRPASAHGSDGKQSPDSPTLGHNSPTIPVMSQAMVDGLEGVEERERERRYMDAIAPLPELALEPKSMRSDGESPAVSGAGSAGEASSPEERSNKRDSYVVDPATIPIRTSSSNAVGNGERYSTVTSPKRSPKKHRSLVSVPERPERTQSKRMSSMTPALDEHDWLASQNPRQKVNGDSLGRNLSVRSQEPQRYASSAFSQQPTLYQPSSQQPLAGTLQQSLGPDLIAQDRFVSWSPEKENILKGPFDYLEAHPGKDIRTQLISAFNAWLRVPEPSLAIIQRVIAMLHTASLLIDDVEDSSLLRRGVPAAHHIFGAPQTINTANYVYFCALQELLTLNNPECIRIYTDELLNLHRGQGMDLFWRDTLTCPSEDDYLEMVGNKTGGLFRLAIKLMCAESPSHNFQPSSRYGSSTTAGPQPLVDYVPLVNTIGLLFQILDDYRNLSSSTYTANKGLCEDLTEGKFSFPIIHAIRSDPQNLVLINILKQKTKDDEVKRFAVSYMEQTGSFAYTRRVLRGLTRKALALVEEVDRAFQSRSSALDSGGPADGGLRGGDMVRAILEKMKVDRGDSVMGAGGMSV